jgi:hypothetical protein
MMATGDQRSRTEGRYADEGTVDKERRRGCRSWRGAGVLDKKFLYAEKGIWRPASLKFERRAS